MLLNGVHLLPDLSGALVWPGQRLVALADPLGPAPARAAPELVRRLAQVLRQRQPAKVVWLGGALPALLAEGRLGRRESTELARMTAAHDWHWLAGEAELELGGLTFRAMARPGNVQGEIAALPSPLATADSQTWPCFVTDGRRLVLPAFGGGAANGVNVLTPPFQALFRRPFLAVMLAGGRILTRPRAKLETPCPPPPR